MARIMTAPGPDGRRHGCARACPEASWVRAGRAAYRNGQPDSTNPHQYATRETGFYRLHDGWESARRARQGADEARADVWRAANAPGVWCAISFVQDGREDRLDFVSRHEAFDALRVDLGMTTEEAARVMDMRESFVCGSGLVVSFFRPEKS